MTPKLIGRIHRWYYNEKGNGRSEWVQVSMADDGRCASYIHRDVDSHATHSSWDEALNALQKTLAANNLPPVDPAKARRFHRYQLDGGVQQFLGEHGEDDGVVSWDLSYKASGYRLLSGNSPTWEAAIEDSLKALPLFRELIKLQSK